MGSGIAQVAAMAGYRTILYDVDAGMVAKGRAAIEKSLASLREKNKLTATELQANLDRLSFIHRVEECVADLIIEAIVEKPDVKLDLFLRLASANDPKTILAVEHDGTARFEAVARGNRHRGIHADTRGARKIGAQAAEIDVVIALVVGVPGDGHVAIRRGGDRGIPIALG